MRETKLAVTPDLSDALRDEDLDPSWEEARRLGHELIDLVIQYLSTVRERPVWQPVPPETAERLARPLPQEGQGARRVIDDFVRDVLFHPLGNIHPRFWGWVIGTGTVGGAFADLLAATMNSNVGGFNQGAVYVEYQVLDWFKELMGYPREAAGILVSGGSMANLTCLVAARNAKAEVDLRQAGLQGAPRRMVLYMSSEGHSSLEKAVEVLGLGNDNLRRVPVDEEYRIDVATLEAMIRSDRQAGLHPFCIIGNAGTVNSGAIDPLDDLADVCQREGLWFHVDGAFGALARLSPRLRPLLAGMERADSIALDAHKWLYVNYEVGCALVRSEPALRGAFSLHPAYLQSSLQGAAAGPAWPSEYGVQLSRGFRALKVWMSLKEHGVDKYARLIEQNVAQAQYLARKVQASSHLELLAPVPLNITCFRYRLAGRSDAELNLLNQELLVRLQLSGEAMISSTVFNGRFALRACFSNHRTQRSDIDLLVEKVEQLGAELAKS